jgi:hypothetical protein
MDQKSILKQKIINNYWKHIFSFDSYEYVLDESFVGLGLLCTALIRGMFHEECNE